ncbi:MAG: hypothetical protein KatS3mg003_1899 [Candidatus Nitrosocaldaceae archaeon]|nr:MAG: hypothetical protein KatS3mg003_1899 [Candidatus Nitrosocaldaceae archaeon]
MSRESELEEIKKIDEIESLMNLSQESLKFLEDEPDIYSIKNIKKRYR